MKTRPKKPFLPFPHSLLGNHDRKKPKVNFKCPHFWHFPSPVYFILKKIDYVLGRYLIVILLTVMLEAHQTNLFFIFV